MGAGNIPDGLGPEPGAGPAEGALVIRKGRANPHRGAAHFLVETIRRVRDAGAGGEITVRADSGFYSRRLIGACRKLDVRFSVTVRQHSGLRRQIEEIAEEDWSDTVLAPMAAPTWPR